MALSNDASVRTDKVVKVDEVTTADSGMGFDVDNGDMEKLTDDTHNDSGREMYLASLQLAPAERDAIAKRVKRKLDFIVLPIMIVAFFLSFLDKQTLNFSSAWTFKEDLGLTGSEYSWVASILNFGYLIAVYPSTVLLQKLPVARFVGVMTFFWGVLLIGMVGVKKFDHVMVIRFFQGAAEACIGPAWMLSTSMLWTREEQSLRMAWWLGCGGLSSLIGSGMSWGLGHHTSGPLKPWQLIYLATGIISAVWGILIFFVFPSDPMSWILFTPEEKLVAVWRVRGNKTGVKHTKLLMYQIRESFQDPKLYFIASQSVCMGILNSASNFRSAFFAGFGYNASTSLLMQLPGGALECVACLLGGFVTSHTRNTMIITIMIGFVPGLAGMVGIAALSLEHQTSLAACLWLQAIFGVSIVLTWALISANVAGHTKRHFFVGTEHLFYAVGNIVGPFLFIAGEAPRYMTAVKSLASLYGVCMVIAGLFGLVMLRENIVRNKRGQTMSESCIDEQSFMDHTDFENKAFRYRI
ncbi:major facilitator superfamily domain-containing protein [Aspergillus cavernicola]|uniref:Major facilitator superfamily domain-containing protein n=1 Tax=Aspergillus cavernicola TaxID=176166 RepID=A0ABR4HAQ6_9EURO